MVGLDLRRQLPHVTVTDTELIVPRAMFLVERPNLFIPERLELRENIFESHCHSE